MPSHQDAYVSDVVVTLDRNGRAGNAATVDDLKRAGMKIASANLEEGIVEGCVESDKLFAIDQMPGVEYVRSVFTYVADYPNGDARDKDGVDRESVAD